MDLTLLLRSDGTAALVSRDADYGDAVDEATWSLSGSILTLSTAEGSSVLLLQDGKLTMVYDGDAMIFLRTGDDTGLPDDLIFEPYGEDAPEDEEDW